MRGGFITHVHTVMFWLSDLSHSLFHRSQFLKHFSSEQTDPHALPSSHPSHHDLRGHGILLSNRAGVVPKHPTPPLVPPGVFCQVHDLINLIFTLWVVLTCYETRIKNEKLALARVPPAIQNKGRICRLNDTITSPSTSSLVSIGYWQLPIFGCSNLKSKSAKCKVSSATTGSEGSLFILCKRLGMLKLAG